ncbi:putative DNA-binding protein (MmcQ/YjbR family) [Winogradskyella wandonensis]|uniref:Putative DNA-binding protein (MmcQ/YjbR family) n=1 Tax=Winogradskyella wandonensis TaxID=1442586 RepID=A0A4R1KK67_9FLAO|nr:MmcQ/YjbR family DNA-binding protein [Winogradskyella wandonensis]TCK65176.1 putative DNA-binding protein (MmcQ/YjbR family) [Winogradskyella wandonensis]
MNIEQFRNYCMNKKEVTEHFPFDEDTLVFKVCNKMFALASLKKWEEGNAFINLKCDPDYAQELRSEYDGVRPGYHMHKQQWNSVYVNNDVPTKLIASLIDHSYDLIVQKLPKKDRTRIQ